MKRCFYRLFGSLFSNGTPLTGRERRGAGLACFGKAKCGANAFSLIEVCLALSVLAFTATSIMGLMTIGFTQMRGSIDREHGQAMSQELLVEAKQMAFSALSHKGSYKRYFSEEGTRVQEGDSSIVYTALVSVDVDPRTGAARPTTLPGCDASQASLLTVTVEIRKTTGGTGWSDCPLVGSYLGMVACRDLSDFPKSSAH